MTPRFLAITGLLLCLCSFLNAQQLTSPSVHQEHQHYYQQFPPSTEAEWDAFQQALPGAKAGNGSTSQAPRPARPTCNLEKKVYGWHPYWVGTAYNNYDFELLSTFCYFSYELDPSTGDYNSIHSWKTTNSINLAQAAGSKVELCVTNFGGTNNTTFLTNPIAQQRCIDSLIALVQYRNANGINIDFEGIPGAQRNNLTTFMQNLSNQLKAAVPGAEVSMAIFAVDWNNVFDIPNLNPYVDQFVIMGYGYHYSGSADAGPTAPLYSGSIWWAYNLTRSVLYYLDQGVTPDNLLIGLPFYGNEYDTPGAAYPDNNLGFQGSRTYAYAKNNYEGVHTKTYDEHSQTPVYTFTSAGQPKQCWVEDEESLAEKFDLVWHKNIGGIGIWALGYDNGYSQIWDLLRDKFSDCGPEYCSDTLFDTGGPMGNYRNNEDYTFTLNSPAGQSIEVNFPVFDVELNWDYLYVYDGPTTASPLLGTFTGSTAPPTLLSTGDVMTFRFTSDNATVTPGFELAWSCVPDPVYADTIYLDHSDSANLDCGIFQHIFYDSNLGAAGNYSDNEKETMTFCAPTPGDAVQLGFRMQVAPVQLDLKSTTVGNDYLRIFDGPDTLSNPIAVYTGSTNSYPQPGTLISSDQCITVQFESDGSSNGVGWEATLRCTTPPVAQGTTFVATGFSSLFEDSGGAAAYGNNESFTRTFCPDAPTLSSGEVIHANFGPIELEQNYDYLHVYDGASVAAPLIGSFTGNTTNQNDLQTLKATENNPSGCLTFQFFSDGATTLQGWSATVSTAAPRKAYGTEACADATLINVAGVPFAGSTTLMTGKPNAEDPPLNISLISLPECSGANEITRLENSIWYKFETPSTPCGQSQINLQLENIACQNSIPGGNGAQIAIYASPTCQTGGGWGSPIYCADKLLQGVPVNIAGLLAPSNTYYILIDGFAGQHCNLDLMLIGDIDGCILPIELVTFEGILAEHQVDLSWTTQQEYNSAGFYVQRGWESAEGQVDFREVGYVSSSPNSSGAGTYAFPDPHFDPNRTNFYRLRQEDLNGESHFHRVIELTPTGGESSLAVYPNPFQNELTVVLPGTDSGSLILTDLSGKRVYQRQMNPGTHELQLPDLPKGVYLYQVQAGPRSIRGKIIHQ